MGKTLASIDMGIRGAIAFFDIDRGLLLDTFRFVTSTKNVIIGKRRDINYNSILKALNQYEPDVVVYEQQFIPNATQGYSREIFVREGFIVGLCYNYTTNIVGVSPKQWTSSYSFRLKEKKGHIHKANQLYPTLKTNHDGVADAVLIGHYFIKLTKLNSK